MKQQCIAYKTIYVCDRAVLIPCGRKPYSVKGKGTGSGLYRRFCLNHAKAYHEILIGILLQGPRREKNETPKQRRAK